MDWGVVAQWIVTICVAGGLIYNMRRNNKSDTRQDTMLKTELKNEIRTISYRLDDPDEGLGAIKKVVEEQRLYCAKFSTELAAQVKHNKEEIDRLRKFNMLPHGGGYKFSDALYVDKVFHVGHKRFYEIVMVDGIGKKIVSNMKELEFSYRSREVILKTIELGLGRPVAELEPVYVVKI